MRLRFFILLAAPVDALDAALIGQLTNSSSSAYSSDRRRTNVIPHETTALECAFESRMT